MPTVRTTDGRTLQFPDGMSQESMAAALRTLPPLSTPPDATPKPNVSPAPQGAMRAVADTLGMPVDLVSFAANSAAAPINAGLRYLAGDKAPQIPQITEPFLGSEFLAKNADKVGAALGVQTAEPDSMGFGDRTAYEATRFGLGALTGGAEARALTNVGKIAPLAGTLGRALREPYTEAADRAAKMPTGSLGEVIAKGYQQARPHIQDALAGAGAGSGVAAIQQTSLKDSPIANMIASLLGGGAGAAGARAAESPGRMISETVKNFTTDPAAGSSSLGAPISRAVSERAARTAQESAFNPASAAENIATRSRDYAAGGYSSSEMPTSGIMSDDPGLIATERAYRGRADTAPKFAKQDKATATKVGSSIKGLADPTAEPRAATNYANAAADKKEVAAQGRIERAQIEKDRAGRAEQDLGATVATPPKSEAAASRDLDRTVVEKGLRPAQEKRSSLYSEREKAASGMAIPLKEYDTLSKDVKASNKGVYTGSNQARDLSSSLGSRVKEDEQTGMTRWADKPVTVGDFTKSSPAISNEIKSAGGTNPNLNRKAAFEKVQKFTNERIPEIIESGGDPGAAAASRAATQYDKNTFFPAYGRGEMQRFRESLNADPDYQNPKPDGLRSNTPATATAGRFLKTGPEGSLELAADLRRAIAASQTPQEGYTAAREVILARMANVVDDTGKVNTTRLRKFILDNDGALDGLGTQGQAIKQELQNTLKEAQGRAGATSSMVKELEDAKLAQQELRREMEQSTLGQIRGRDPSSMAKTILGAKDPARAMAEAKALFANDTAAAAGFKRAITDEIHAKVTNPAGATNEDWVASYSKLAKTDQKRYDEVLSQIYTPEELTALNRGRQVMANLQNRFLRGSVGSNTAEDMQASARIPLPLQVMWRLHRGQIAGGGEIKGVNQALKLLQPALEHIPGVGAQVKADAVLQRAWFDPALMKHLLTMPTTAGYPAWNRTLNRLMAVQAGARESTDSDPTTKRQNKAPDSSARP